MWLHGELKQELFNMVNDDYKKRYGVMVQNSAVRCRQIPYKSNELKIVVDKRVQSQNEQVE